jgi:hypothetical protein
MTSIGCPTPARRCRRLAPISDREAPTVSEALGTIEATVLRWLVDETDGCADDEPLNEVGDALVEREPEAYVQIDVVVNDEGADRENADECAEVYAGGDAPACRINFCVENGDDHDADQDGDHAVGHDLHHALMRAVDVGVLHELGLQGWHGAEHDEAIDEVGDGGAERRESDAGVVHGHPFEAGLGSRRILHCR